MAFGNAMLGICHSMAHKLGAQFHVPHGLANAALISHVIRFNATDRPPKQVRGAGVHSSPGSHHRPRPSSQHGCVPGWHATCSRFLR